MSKINLRAKGYTKSEKIPLTVDWEGLFSWCEDIIKHGTDDQKELAEEVILALEHEIIDKDYNVQVQAPEYV